MARTAEGSFTTDERSYVYHLYGVSLRSPWRFPFSCTEGNGCDTPEITLHESGARVQTAPTDATARTDAEAWFEHVSLEDGSTYLRWSSLFEFFISSDGRQIMCHPLESSSWEALHTYLLGQVLSFALVRQGIEPLHSTVVVRAGEAVALVGDCGYGKSTLGAAFLQAGYSLLTDDLLVVKKEASGWVAYPGLPRIKLFPEMAKALLGGDVTGIPMNPDTPKLIIPLNGRRSTQTAMPLTRMYVLEPPKAEFPVEGVTIRTMSQREAVLALIANTFNSVVREPDRLAQQFQLGTRLAASLPVKSLSYARDLAQLPKVVEAVQADLA